MSQKETYFNPFPGLRSFEEDEEYLFFGRETQIDELLGILGKQKFLAVVGASGSGKSSLVKSGLLPSLHSGFMSGIGSGWKISVFRPGDDPIGNLAKALCSEEILDEHESMDQDSWPMVLSVLRRSKKGIEETIRQFGLYQGENLLLVVDQFEELFRFSKYEKVAQKGTRDSVVFINLLLEVVKQSKFPVYIVFTMRSDFLGNCTEFRGLPETINEGLYLIPRMTREERKVAITGPIKVGGAEISQPLLTMLLNEVGDNPDQLPILQHALMRTWDYWMKNDNPDNPIDVKHYEAIGRMEHALSFHADEAYGEIPDKKGKEICEHMFKALTDEGTTAGGVRKPTKVSELMEYIEAPLDKIVPIIEIFRQRGRSFLMPPVGVEITEDTVIDISHESLMRVWERLSIWVREEAESADIYKRIANAAALYQEGKAGLYRNPELQIAQLWRERVKPNEKWAMQYDKSYVRAMTFLDHSQQAHDFALEQKEIEQKKRLKRSRIIAIVISIAFVVALVMAVFAYMKELEAVEQTKLATHEKELAILAQEETAREHEIAEQQRELAEKQSKIAIENQKAAEQAKLKAEKLALIAQEQKNKAIIAQQLTEVKSKEAIQARDSANQAFIIAEKARVEAENAKLKAIASQQEAQRLRNLAEATNKAFVAAKLLGQGKYEQAKDSALLSYDMYAANGGVGKNTEIYNVLNQVWNAEESGGNSFTEHTEPIRSIQVNPNNGQLISVDENGKVIFSEFANNKLSKKSEVKMNHSLRKMDVSVDGSYVVTSDAESEVRLYRSEEFEAGKDALHQFNVKGGLLNLQLLKNESSNYLLVGNSSGSRVYEFNENAINPVAINSMPLGHGLLSVSPDFNYAVTTNTTSFTINKVISGNDGLQIKPVLNDPVVGNVTSVAYFKQSNYIAVGLSTGQIYVYSISNLENHFVIHNHKSSVTSIKFVPIDDGLLLISGSYDNTCVLVDLKKVLEGDKTASNGVVLKGHSGWIYDISISKDQRYLFSASKDKSIRYWFIYSSDLVNTLKNR